MSINKDIDKIFEYFNKSIKIGIPFWQRDNVVIKKDLYKGGYGEINTYRSARGDKDTIKVHFGRTPKGELEILPTRWVWREYGSKAKVSVNKDLKELDLKKYTEIVTVIWHYDINKGGFYDLILGYTEVT